MPAVCEAAPKAELRAFAVPGSPSVAPRLFVSARGTLRDACWSVTIQMSPLRVWPPEFLLEACHVRTGCAEVLTPYDVSQSFELGSIPAYIVVRDSEGPHEVEVEIVPDRSDLTGGSENASVDEAIGVSIGRASLGEALSDAVRKLYADQHPNQPRAVRVVEITYSEGGIMPPVLSVRATKS